MKKSSLRTLNITEMGEITAGNGFCDAVYAGEVIWSVGVLATWWSPPGAAATVALLVVDGYCHFYG